MMSNIERDRKIALQAGRRLANCKPGEEVCISGIAGFFPDSDNVRDFGEKLFNKVDLISDDDRRWKLEHPEIPQRTGKLNEVSKFDAAFFGVHFKQAHTMDPMCRMLLEKAYEAIVDAGYNPRHLRGTNTGVFIGACFSESEKTWFYEKLQVNGFGITGCSRAMLANRISYWLGINGPSYTVDSACSSSLYALEHAYKSIRDGHCDAAIVGGCNLCLHPYVSLQFARLGVLSADGRCKSFDEAANGYCRSEAISVILLQKLKDSRRVYARVIHAKTNCDGYKEQGITFPSGPLQQRLLEEFYEECQIEPSSLAWIEAHGTGTKVGDPEEVKAIENVFCEGRKEPLPIGSVKSNIGHSEPASGLCSVTKVVIAMETGFIPPNINFNTPRKDIDAFFNGKIKVVTDKTPWNGGMVGVNSFGFGGANCHVLLNWNEKTKVNGGAPEDDLPRLIPVSGRTEDAVEVLLKDIESRPLDVEYVKLFHEIYVDDIPGHIYRGYALMTPNDDKITRSVQYYPGDERPIWFVFSGMGSQWPGMGRALLRIPIFSAAIERCQRILKPKGIDVLKIITDDDPKVFNNIVNSFVGIAAIQIGLLDILHAAGIQADNMIGHSVGELGCAYADGCFTTEQMILSAYYRGLASIESEFIKGCMAAIGLGFHEIKPRLPMDIEVACHNGPDSCTISGPAESIHKFVKELQAEKIFAREVNVANIAYHSRYIANAGPKLLKYLQQVIPSPKARSEKWISTSLPESQWNSSLAKLSSAEYHTNNLLRPVLFEEACRLIPHRAILIEIAPHGLLQAILKRSLSKDILSVSLTQRDHKDNAHVLFNSLGKLFEAGLTPKLSVLYPPVALPVSRGTPMIAPLVRWEHSEDWYVTSYRMQEKIKSGERSVNISLKDDELEYLSGHVIDGRNLYPATGYLALAWETVGLMRGELYTEVPVIFENVRFHRATNIPKDGSVEFIVMVQKGSGNFEVVEGGAAIVTGKITVPNDITKETINMELPEDTETGPDLIELSAKDIYKELRLRGYNYKGLFRSLVAADTTGKVGRVSWCNNWVAFMDNLLQIQILQDDTRGLFVPTSLQRMVIDVRKHISILHTLDPEKPEMQVNVYKEIELIKSGGVEIRGLKASAISRRKPLGEPVLEKYLFYPQEDEESSDLAEVVRVAVQLALENLPSIKVKTVEMADAFMNPDVPLISTILATSLGDLPLIQADITVLSASDNPVVADMAPGIQVEDRKLPGDQSCHIVVVSSIVGRPEVLQLALNALKDGGFMIAREKITEKVPEDGLSISMNRICGSERILIIRREITEKLEPIVIKVPANNFEWITELQNALKAEDSSTKQKIILYAEKEPLNGLLGFFNCIRKEAGGERTRCVLVMDKKAPPFSVNHPFYKEQLAKDLAVNIYKDGKWGSYRHLLLEELSSIKAVHRYVNTTVRGDLSSLQWFEGEIEPEKMKGRKAHEESLIHVYFGALNFRDIMLATGKIAPEVVARGRLEQECVLGLEYSGRDATGQRVMGMCFSRGMASVLKGDKSFIWPIPDHWSLEEAATVPVTYGTSYYALMICGRMREGDTVLIHAGSGGVGLSAIQLCLFYGCTVFTTVGTPEKRAFIKKMFPQITDNHIGNSRDTSFEQLVMKETNGRGVDLVLNSLAEEKLQASVRCLAQGGRFLEIGKFDLANNNMLGMEMFLKETSFHGVMLDSLFSAPEEWKEKLHSAVTEGIKCGAIKPLVRTVFEKDEIEQAFRYMAAGKHVGKVLIRVRNEEPDLYVKPEFIPQDCLPRFRCTANFSFIVCGGLGGFGLELADWLILRGARKIVLTSRVGLRTGYQASRIRVWRSYGVEVVISTADITTHQGVELLLKQANALGPVKGIFNLAVVLKDALFENQTVEDFEASSGPKANATIFLDKLSRKLCPELEQFVIFSSVSCGRGNAGQTNYGLSNSVMERICEMRHAESLPALAVEWGAVGEVGLVADMAEDNLEVIIGGTLQQRISSCLEVLDTFLRQNHPIVASMVVAEKRAGGGGAGNIVDAVVNILGLRDLKTVSLHSTLAELGMDSMMAVEIKQTLEREFEVFLTPQDIRGMTFAKLQDIAAQTNSEDKGVSKGGSDLTKPLGDQVPEVGLNFLLRTIGDELMASEPIVRLPSLSGDGSVIEDMHCKDTLIFAIPGVEGVASIMEPLAKNLNAQVLCLQYDFERPASTIQELAQSLVPHIKKRLRQGKEFNICGYSFGGMVALEVARILESENISGKIWLVDSSPQFLKTMSTLALSDGEKSKEDELQVKVIMRIVDLVWPQDTTELVQTLYSVPDLNSRIEYVVSASPEDIKHSKRYQKLLMVAGITRIKSVLNYEIPSSKFINSPVVLIRPSEQSMPFAEDYGLSQFCVKPVDVFFVDGNHLTILENKKTADIIMKLVEKDDQDFKQAIMSQSNLASLQEEQRRV
ncbi:unnamed protein product [Bemisia tabaci]|uniref:Uncharacterized protein n=1 Tax=Bemisia tabaci TaxID=7038 RepID=A0A9P0A6Y2_BEMTA|nr:fatty acid synthase [Bemisia tabaci]CAH0385876.1 unnamed protein product [Bemisia tabaci]